MGLVTSIKTWALAHTPLIFSIIRTIKPNISFSNTVLITRFSDVQEALSRPDALGVTYADKMAAITNGGSFFLGMNNTETYTRDVSNMRIAVRRSDISEIVTPVVAKFADDIVSQSTGKMDVITELTNRVPSLFSAEYLGVAGPSEQALYEWTSTMFQFLFYPGNPKEVDAAAIANGQKTCTYLDELIKLRKLDNVDEKSKDDIIARCIALQKSGTPGMTDVDIRNNLLGIIIGLVPTTSKCAILMLDYLLDHPELLAGAQQAALNNDDELLRKYMLETLRLNSFGAGIFREATEDYVIASGTLRSKKIKKGMQVLVATQSAMLDGRVVKNPKEFKLDRPDYHYMHFGFGMHTCFGQYINMVQIPLIVKSLLRCKNLRRANGAAGQVQYQDPFPTHLHVEFDAVKSEQAANTTIKDKQESIAEPA